MRKTLGIILPVYNGERYIKDAILSVLAQEDRPDQFIVFDNKSTDNTKQILEELSTTHNFKVVYSEVHLSRMVDSWNRAVSLLNTDWYHLLSADDLIRPNFVSEFRKYLDTESAAISMLSEDISESGNLQLAKIGFGATKVIKGSRLVEMNLWSSKVNVASVSVRKSVWESLGGYPPDYEYLHDLVFWQNLADWGGILKVQRVVARYRVDGSKAKAAPRRIKIENEFRKLEETRYPKLSEKWGIEANRPQHFASRSISRTVLVKCVSVGVKLLYALKIVRW